MSAKVYTAPCAYGVGVFAKCNIEQGEEIFQLTGDVIDPDLPQYNDNSLDEAKILQIGDNAYIYPEVPGVLANHSCNPNAGIRRNSVIFALRPIKQDEEIAYDYSTTMYNDPWTLHCKCQAKNCRGVVRQFNDLPKEVQEFYYSQGAISDFVRSKFQP